MKHFITIIIPLFFWISAFSQDIPSNYRLLATIDRPNDLKWGVPNEILLDSTFKYLIIAYDYNPTYLDLYNIIDLKFIKRIVVSGQVYLDNSYFYLKDNCLFIDYGRYKNKYRRIDLSNFSQVKIGCEFVPRGCPYRHIIDTKSEYFGDVTVTNNEWYLLKYDKHKTTIYLK
jgi:hypothetical protein